MVLDKRSVCYRQPLTKFAITDIFVIDVEESRDTVYVKCLRILYGYALDDDYNY